MIFKRFFDISISLFLLFILLPVFILISFLILIDTRGPIFFCQERIGKNFQIFNIYKFRSMYSDSDPYQDSPNSCSDHRITRVGRILREFSLDEIPQLINVIKSEMSLIGPRPIYSKVANRLNEEQKKRFTMKPGITGLAQINGRTNLTWKERIEFDCYYVDHWSMVLDIGIFFKTIILIFSKKNIYEIDASMDKNGI